MALEFTTMAAAGKFGDTCEFPIMDLRPMVNDRVLASIPRFLFRWEEGTTMDILLDDNYTFVEAEDDCDFVKASREVLTCTIIVPNQEEIMVGEENVKFERLMRRFCNAQSLVKFPTLFRRDGSLDTGQPLAGPFIRFLLSELRGPYMQRLITSAWTGDAANANYITGILTQITDPVSWETKSDQACDLYRANYIDWDAATAGTGLAAPADVIDATQDTFVIRGQTFDGLTGLDLVHLIKLYMERLVEYDLSTWAEDMVEFELWVPQGQVNCIAELAACMTPCEGCVNPLSDPAIRARASQFQKDRVIWLYPYDNYPIKILTSPHLVNKMIFLPKSVGGNPLAGWVFRDQDEQLSIVEGELPFYGAQTGRPDPTELYPGDGPIDGGEFEERAFSLHVQRNGDCLDFWLKSESAILLFGLHMWLIIDNVTCTTLTPRTIPSTVMSFAVTVCIQGADDFHLVLTVPTLDGTTDYNDVGDVWALHWSGGQVLIGTVSAWNDTGDLLTIAFPATGPEVSCTLGVTGNVVERIALIEDAA